MVKNWSDQALIASAIEFAVPAGYEGLLTARKFHLCAGSLLDHVEREYGPVAHCWATVAHPGTPGIPEHGHHRKTVVYYPHDHACGIEVEGKLYPAKAGSFVEMETGAMHSVPANDTDETRVSIVFTLER